MAYTKENYLDRIKEVNEIYSPFSMKGVPNETIYREHIKKRFKISRSTFYKYLKTPYDTELEEIRKKKSTGNNSRRSFT